MGTNQKLQNRLRSGSKNLDNRNPVLNEDEEDDDNAVYEQDEFEPIDHQFAPNGNNIQNNTFYAG